ncbi:MAG: anaerobic ribonucleoside-triphosphate reductase activating protein, partial [Proteobacteria bacterium]|nr:anaerobic ribonucleoside-triphosphate reductase activating protein [Pseudomonadota bacterium]
MSAIQADIKGFLETSFIDWPGQVASVLFLAGCNFRCPFCHNHGLVLRPDDYPGLSWNSIRDRLARFPGWIDGVVITGGEPTLSPGLADLAREIKDMGFQVKLDTNGGRPEVLAGLIEADLLDHVAMDVKGPLDDVSYARA